MSAGSRNRGALTPTSGDRRRAPRPRRGAFSRWWAPTAQALTLVVLLSVSLTHRSVVLADVAADRGLGTAVAVKTVTLASPPPVGLEVPALGIKTRLIGLRKTREGALQVPADPQRAGWYSEGPAPGDRGSAVIAGHVDSYRGPGIFAKLGSLKKGDKVVIRRVDGSRLTYVVRAVETYSKRHFPTARVYGPDGTVGLRLITCGGEFDQGAKTYLSNTVVYANLLNPVVKKKVVAS